MCFYSGKRILKKRETPKPVEDAKNTLIIRGKRTKEDLTQLLKEFYDIKKPFAKSFMRKHDDNVFEDPKHVVEMCVKDDCALFMMGKIYSFSIFYFLSFF